MSQGLQFLHARVDAFFAEEMQTVFDNIRVPHHVHTNTAGQMLDHLIYRHQRHLVKVEGQRIDVARLS